MASCDIFGQRRVAIGAADVPYGNALPVSLHARKPPDSV